MGDPSGPTKHSLRGLYLTDNPNLVVDGNDTVIHASYPTVMDDPAPVKENLFPNGSFEAGTGYGWGFSAGGGNRALPQVALGPDAGLPWPDESRDCRRG